MGTNSTVFKWSKNITPSQVERLMRSEKDLKKATLIFDSATAEYANGFRHDHTTFGCMISKLVSANQFRSAESLLARMRDDKCKIQEDIFLALCRGYGRVHRPWEAIRIFHNMEEFHCKPTSKSYVTVLSILVDENQLKQAFGFYKYMKQMGIPLNLASINILLKALCKKTHTLASALQMFREMPRRGFAPDSYTYGTLINGLCRLGKVDDAKKLFGEMEVEGCSPTVVTYTNLIHGLCRCDCLGEAMKLFDEMTSKGIDPNVFTYSSLMDGLCKAGQSWVALELFNQMISKCHSPNMVTYSTLIYGLCKDKMLREAVEILDRMKIQGLQPDVGLYGKIITGFCSVSKFEEAGNFLDEMVLEGVSPNRVTWSVHVRIHNSVVRGLCGMNLDRAFQLYLSLRSRGISVDSATFECLVRRFSERGDLHKAGQIVDEMVVDGCVPDEQTWRFVVDGFWNRRKLREAALRLMDGLNSNNTLIIRKA